jgi:hypothetical protein
MLKKSKEELLQQIDASIARIEAEQAASPVGTKRLDDELNDELHRRNAVQDVHAS